MEIIVSGVTFATAHVDDKDVKKILSLAKKSGRTIEQCIQELYDKKKITLNINFDDADFKADDIVEVWKM